MPSIKRSAFLQMELVRSYLVVDKETGDLVRREVRRNPSTGLLLTNTSD